MFVLRVFCCKVKILSFPVHSVRQKVIINTLETMNHSLFFFILSVNGALKTG